MFKEKAVSLAEEFGKAISTNGGLIEGELRLTQFTLQPPATMWPIC